VTTHHIDFEPIGRRGDCPVEQTLLDCAHQLGVDLVSLCGGVGTCYGCKIQVMKGTVSPPTSTEKDFFSAEELAQGYRLACQTYAKSDVKVRVPPESITAQQRTQVEGMEVPVAPDPSVRAYEVTLPVPSLKDLRADDRRLLDILKKQHKVKCSLIDNAVLREMSTKLRAQEWQAQAAVRDSEVVVLSPVKTSHLGLAVDIGTTKIAGYLVDLATGKTLAATGIMNPQISYGEDVITRIGKARESAAEAARLQKVVVTALNQITIDLCGEVKAKPENIVEAVVVGNTAMHHLFLGLPVTQLGLAPYVPAVSQALDVKSREIGLKIAPGAYVHLLPNIAGFVGADLVAGLITTEPWLAGKAVLYVDIGTNTEVCLVYGDQMTSASCASGPAFEGAHIQCGMRAASGAIERLRLVDKKKIEYQTIHSTPPVGLCGSGILDAIAQLYLAGIIDRGGKMLDNSSMVQNVNGRNEVVLVREGEREGSRAVVITQQDVREIQLAKGAIYTGIKLLLENAKRSAEEIEQVIIAGAFGSYIDVASAMTIGMLPRLPLKRFKQVGNAAGTGARLALISRQKRAEAQAISRKVKYIELAADPRFMSAFVDALKIGYNNEGG
jgi:uncharacterized 2Fe-2S/4Fe-4S cluster protein (DUF4445 family)